MAFLWNDPKHEVFLTRADPCAGWRGHAGNGWLKKGQIKMLIIWKFYINIWKSPSTNLRFDKIVWAYIHRILFSQGGFPNKTEKCGTFFSKPPPMWEKFPHFIKFFLMKLSLLHIIYFTKTHVNYDSNLSGTKEGFELLEICLLVHF